MRCDRLADLAAQRGGQWAKWLALRAWPQGAGTCRATEEFEYDAATEACMRGEEHHGVRQILAIEELFAVELT